MMSIFKPILVGWLVILGVHNNVRSAGGQHTDKLQRSAVTAVKAV